MSAWRLAKSIGTLRDQINAAHPNRNKSDDGTIGDARHQAEHSEHNPDKNGVVRAIDISNDPAHGADSDVLARAIIASRDSRILYMISQRQICSSVVSPWVWRAYHGSDPHVGHFHLSVVESPALYDSIKPWTLGAPATPQPSPPVTPYPAPGKVFTNITATEFGGVGDVNASAYGGMVEPDKPGVALPFHFSGARPHVRVTRGVHSVICEIVDVGPWYPSKRGPADPYWETGARPRAESDNATNYAGIDLTPAAWAALGAPGLGKGLVDWQFVTLASDAKGA